MNAAWGGQWDMHEIIISLGSHQTTDNLSVNPEFTVTFATTASSRQTVENWLKKLGVDKQSTAINNVRTRSVDNGVSYSLNGMRSSGQRGIQIRNGNKYIKQ